MWHMSKIISLVVLALTPSVAFASVDLSGSNCTSTREFIATLQYLRSGSEVRMPEAEARKIAMDVSNGCTGAGLRFIKASDLLLKSGVSSVDALKTALELSHSTDAVLESFLTVFREAFLKEHLDLDLSSSLALARELSTDFHGDVLQARDDFKTLSDFCAQDAQLGLPKPECAQFAVRLVRKGESFSGGISRSFVDTFHFLRSNSGGPGLSTGDALKLDEQLVGYGFDAGRNFEQAFRYAVARKGLGMDNRSALDFAQKMAAQTHGGQSAPQN